MWGTGNALLNGDDTLRVIVCVPVLLRALYVFSNYSRMSKQFASNTVMTWTCDSVLYEAGTGQSAEGGVALARLWDAQGGICVIARHDHGPKHHGQTGTAFGAADIPNIAPRFP